MTPEGTAFQGISFNPSERSYRRFGAEHLERELRDPAVFSWIDLQAPDMRALNDLLHRWDIDLVLASHFDEPEILPRIVERPECLAFYLYGVVDPEEHLDTSRDMLDGILAAVQAAAANRTSEVARVLTVLSGILLPLTLITGIYGMNFEHMPELKWRYGYVATLAGLALVGTILFLVFRRLGWVGRGRRLR